MKLTYGAMLGLLAACGARTGLFSDAAYTSPDAGLDIEAGAEADAGPDADAGPGADAGLDAAVEQDAAAPRCAAGDAGAMSLEAPDAAFTCSVALTAGVITPSDPSCFVDIEVMTGAQGSLDYACDGGPAQVTFGAHQFPGLVIGGQLEICFGTTFPFSDGCTWQSAQGISGAISSGALAFTYAEQPEPGQQGCESSCTAMGTILVK